MSLNIAPVSNASSLVVRVVAEAISESPRMAEMIVKDLIFMMYVGKQKDIKFII
jgi:hypothetical protein